MQVLPSDDFPGTDRFRVVRRLGAGGMGVVYEALDRERDAAVALKTLRTVDADALLRFKHEFRALQDIQHENLVSLGELIEHEGRWFFTMDLVEGDDFLAHVRPSLAGPDRTPSTRAPELEDKTIDLQVRSPAGAADRLQRATTSSGAAPLSPLDEARLRAALAQLARGVHELHLHRKVHRDLKPSNILVTRAGRVVVLDFGLVIDTRSDDRDSRIAGTASFMAPEQGVTGRVGPEADWYAVGVILYIALTGRAPFRGTPDEILERKQLVEPVPPSSLALGVPGDLERLSLDLLRIDPSARPSGREVLARLGVAVPEAPAAVDDAEPAPFVGRAAELAALDEAFAAAAEHGVSVYLRGESGIGKSTLARRFTDELVARAPDTVVLAGRCFERESVPYKAFDAIVDELSRFLARLPRDEASLLMPRKPWLLRQVFPQLGGVPVLDEGRRPAAPLPPQELRTQAFAALRELFGRLADRRRVVLVIDDLQWADADSFALLSEVMRPPDEPSLLLIATVRADASPATPGGDVRTLQLGALSPDEARRFAAALTGASSSARAEAIAAEAGGHPLFIGELAASDRAATSLDDALGERIGRIDARARILLELVAVAGMPLCQRTAADAAELSLDELAGCVATLRRAHLVQTRGARVSDTVEPYHDRIRRAVLQRMALADLRACYRRLAVALERGGPDKGDLEAVALYWQGAGDAARAARFAVEAAEEATRTLAFDRAARLYRLALELAPMEPDAARRVQRHLGDALANAGRGAEAAQAYQQAAALATADEAHDLERLAAEHLLFSGRFDEGLASLERVLAGVGLALPATPRRALVSLLWHRLRIRLGGGRVRELPPSEIPPDRRRLIDSCHAAGIGLGLIDVIRGAEFQARQILYAHAGSDPFRLARALAAEATFSAAQGQRGARRTDSVVRACAAMAERSGQPAALGWATGAAGFSAFQRGQWKRACEQLMRAEEILREQCCGMAWERATVQSHLLFTFGYLGRFGDAATLGRQWLRSARERGDLFASTMLRLALTTVYLAEDDPAGGRREADDALAHWSPSGFHLQHFHAMHSRVRCALYIGDVAGARALLEADRPALEASLLLRFQIMRIVTLNVRTQLALSSAGADGAETARWRKEAAATVHQIGAEHMPWSDPLALLYRGCGAALGGARDDAARLLDEAERGFGAADMCLHAAVARLRRGQLVGSAELRAEGEAAVAACGVRNPLRFAAHYAPGIGEP